MPPVIPGVAKVPRKVFVEKLGTNALSVWGFLRQLRDHYGRVHPTIGGISRKTSLHPESVKRALERLRQTGLVEDVGYRWTNDAGKLPQKVYVRRVYGCYLGRDDVQVPFGVWGEIMALKGGKHGGARPGTGKYPRKKHSSDPQDHTSTHKEPSGRLNGGTGHSSDLLPPHSSDLSGGAFKRPAYVVATDHSKQEGEIPMWDPSSLRSEGCAADAAPRPSSSVEKPRDTLPPVAATPKVINVAPPGLPAHLRDLFDIQPGKNTKPFFWGQDGAPTYPAVIDTHITIPPPPRVPTGRSREDQIAFCVKWYRAAVESRLGKCHPISLSGPVKGFFEDALDIWVEKDIRPGAWVAWALDRILLKLPPKARTRFHPQVKVLLSPKLLTEKRWMFREEEADYTTTVYQKTAAGEEFMRRFRSVEWEVRAIPGWTEADVRRAVERIFPEGYLAARRECRAKTESEGQGLRARLQLGGWLWKVPRQLRGAA